MYDSTEMSPKNFAPLGVPGNPLDGTPGSQDAKRPQKWWDKGTKKPLQLPGRLSFQEMADVGTPPKGVPLAQEPHQLLTPDVVSATDPAYSMHPVIKQVLAGLSRVPASSVGGDASPITGSAFTQWMGQTPQPMSQKTLNRGLKPKLGTQSYQKQGSNDSVGSN